MHSITKTRTRALGALALTLALGVGLTACGDDGSDAATKAEVSTTEHNSADVAFASDMITHHAQALSMVDLTLDRDLDPEVQALAEDIREAQGPEIETMADWLTAWGEDVPATMRDHVNGGHDMDDMSDNMDDMGHDDMPGMMSADDIDELENSSDAEFQDMWLEMMIEHHEGAVEMAQTEQSDGRFKDAVDLAGQVITTQTAEIETMKELLGS
ncbi:Lipoprotein [metagenome]|uniref:Lipoprotein n=1 Tax=metagenome TaxID=256318 RepID=A0A2P2CD16_9ZZZZ